MTLAKAGGGISPPDPAAAEPFYRQIYDRFRGAIASGALKPGDRIPSARALAQELGLARGTVEAAYSLGTRWYTILFRHVLPNAIGPIMVLVTLDFGSSILAVSALSFLGYGAEPPAPEWGTLVASGRNYMANAWWLTTMPGLTVAATVLATNRIARAMR